MRSDAPDGVSFAADTDVPHPRAQEGLPCLRPSCCVLCPDGVARCPTDAPVSRPSTCTYVNRNLLENATVYDLSALGFGPFFEQQFSLGEERPLIPARIAAEHRGAYEVWSCAGSGVARLTGRLRAELQEEGMPGVGDWVALHDAPRDDHTCTIERVFARRTVFMRGAAGRSSRAQVVAANVDWVFVVCGLDGDFSIRRIERFLARIAASGAQSSVILNKADLCADATARTAEVEAHCHGVPVYVTSAVRSEGIDAIRANIPSGVTAAFVGSSGAGKSSLVNALLGEQRMNTGAVRTRDDRGCHVTTHRQLVLLPEGGGLVLDTPGMRELGLLDEQGLDTAFDDISKLAAGCRYRDCHHDTEPGCAVKEAALRGELVPERLAHYRKLEREAVASELRQDERLRRQSERVWGRSMHHDVALIRRWKGEK